MTRRVLAQFSFAVLAAAMTAGVALADSATPITDPGTTQQLSSQCTTAVSATGSTQVQTTATCDQTTGVGSASTAPSINSPGGTSTGTPNGGISQLLTNGPAGAPLGTSSDQSAPMGLSGTSTPPPALTPPANPPAPPTTPVATPANTTSATSVAALASVDRAVAAAAINPNPPVLLASSAPAMPQPGTPKAPLGFLNQLHLLLSQVVVPAGLGLVVHTLPGVSQLGLLSFAIILLLIAAVLPSNSHTARLRRSGFLGAARSDVGALNLLFATPREMSFIGATTP